MGEEQKIKEMPVWKSVLFIVGGLAGLIFGGQLFVEGASGIARSLGVSESVRIDFGGRRYFVARAGHFCYGCIEEESGYCHRQR